MMRIMGIGVLYHLRTKIGRMLLRKEMEELEHRRRLYLHYRKTFYHYRPIARVLDNMEMELTGDNRDSPVRLLPADILRTLLAREYPRMNKSECNDPDPSSLSNDGLKSVHVGHFCRGVQDATIKVWDGKTGKVVLFSVWITDAPRHDPSPTWVRNSYPKTHAEAVDERNNLRRDLRSKIEVEVG